MTTKRNRTVRARLAQTIRNTLGDYKRDLYLGRSLARAAATLEELIRQHNDGGDVVPTNRVVRTAAGHWTTLGMALENGAALDRRHWSFPADVADDYLPAASPATHPDTGTVLSEGVISGATGRLYLTK